MRFLRYLTEKKCPHCGGTGKLKRDNAKDVECPMCKGTGVWKK